MLFLISTRCCRTFLHDLQISCSTLREPMNHEYCKQRRAITNTTNTCAKTSATLHSNIPCNSILDGYYYNYIALCALAATITVNKP